jgi:hypothetical protein
LFDEVRRGRFSVSDIGFLLTNDRAWTTQFREDMTMKKNSVEATRQMCPSAQPQHEGARVFGVQTGTSAENFRVGYLTEAHPVTEELLALAGHAAPTEILRIAAYCVKCEHHDGVGCRLATRVATMLEPVVNSVPRCAVRPTCLWFHQEGKAACVRCPQVTTIKRWPTAFEKEVSGLPVQQAGELPSE